MTKFRSIDGRLRAIAERRGGGTAMLKFADGSTRSLRVGTRNGQLRLVLDAFEKMRSHPPDPPTEVESNEILMLAAPEPATRSDAALELLGRAESVEGPRLFQFVHGLAQTMREGRRAAGGETARTLEREK